MNNNKSLNLALVQKHPYHLVDPSPWPILTSFSVFMFACGGLLHMHSYKNGGLVLSVGLFFLLCCISCWWRDVIRESTFEGHHSVSCKFVDPFLSRPCIFIRIFSYKIMKLMNAKILTVNRCSTVLTWPLDSYYDLYDTERSIRFFLFFFYLQRRISSIIAFEHNSIWESNLSKVIVGYWSFLYFRLLCFSVSCITINVMFQSIASYQTIFIRGFRVINARSIRSYYAMIIGRSGFNRFCSIVVTNYVALVPGGFFKGKTSFVKNEGANSSKDIILPKDINYNNIFDVITAIPNLKAAWWEIKHKSGSFMPVVDDLILTGVLNSWCTQVSEELQKGIYIYAKVSDIYLKKKCSENTWLIKISLKDTIIQRAFLRILEPYFEGDYCIKQINELRYYEVKLVSLSSVSARSKYLTLLSPELRKKVEIFKFLKNKDLMCSIHSSVFRKWVIEKKDFAYFERIWIRPKLFSTSSHGFRTGLGIHSVLQQIKSWPGNLTWWLEYDIVKTFGNVNYNRLLNILGKYVPNQRMLDEIRKMLQALVVLPNGLLVSNIRGVFQGFLLSSLLLNIYLNEFDQMILKFQQRKSYLAISKDLVTSSCIEVKFTGRNLSQLIKKFGVLEVLNMKKKAYKAFVQLKQNSTYDSNSRVYYSRYCGVFLFAILGSRAFALKVREVFTRFLQSDLHLRVKRSLLTSVQSGVKIRFLGFLLNIQVKSKLNLSCVQNRENSSRKRRKILARIHSFNVACTGVLERLAKKSFLTEVNKVGHLLNLRWRSMKKISAIKRVSRIVALKIIRKKLMEIIKDLIKSIDYQLQVSIGGSSSLGKTSLAVYDPLLKVEKQQSIFKYLNLLDFMKVSLQNSWRDLGIQDFSSPLGKLITNLNKFCDVESDNLKRERINSSLFCIGKKNSQPLFELATKKQGLLRSSKVFEPISRGSYILINSDIKEVRMRLKELQIIQLNNSQYRYVPFLINEKDYKIIQWFTDKAFGFLNWFRCADNFSDIKRIVDYTLRHSLLMTLAHKHKLSHGSIIQKYGLTPKVYGNEVNKKVFCNITKVDVSLPIASFLESHFIRSLSKSFLLGKLDPSLYVNVVLLRKTVI